jgi:hypothetical protein
MKIIGKKEKFALQYEILYTNPILISYYCLWINNCQIGDLEDASPIFPLYNVLKRLIDQRGSMFDEEFLAIKSDDSLFNYLVYGNIDPLNRQINPKLDKYMVFLGENFDRWIIRVIANNGVYKFIWKEPISNHSHDLYDKVHSEEVDYIELLYVYKGLEKKIYTYSKK